MSVLAARARAPSPQRVAPGVYLVTLERGAAASNAYLAGGPAVGPGAGRAGATGAAAGARTTADRWGGHGTACPS